MKNRLYMVSQTVHKVHKVKHVSFLCVTLVLFEMVGECVGRETLYLFELVGVQVFGERSFGQSTFGKIHVVPSLVAVILPF